MAVGRPNRPGCEIDRAFLELLGRPRSDTPEASSLCSVEPPEPREYPASPIPGRAYVLCNGHLRDLFDELARAHPLPPAASLP